jgi:hypothetical protein
MAIQDDANRQLGALPFGNIIGGPLVAAIEAQALAARRSVEFIQSIAFKPDQPDQLQTIQFAYKRRVQGAEKAEFEDAVLQVPLLVLVPVPYIRIDDMTIQFKANINAESTSKDTTQDTEQKEVKGEIKGKYGWGPAKVEASFSASYSAKKDSTSARDSKYAVEYTMDVYVHAVNEDKPSGLATILNLLTKSIQGGEDDNKDKKEIINKLEG